MVTIVTIDHSNNASMVIKQRPIIVNGKQRPFIVNGKQRTFIVNREQMTIQCQW